MSWGKEASASTSNKALLSGEESNLSEDKEDGSHANKIEGMDKRMKQIKLKSAC